jgi:DNA primase
LFNESILSEIKNRIELVEFISDYAPLKKAGRNWKGLCPFHQENTPSFVVSEDKQIFHCFGCHEGGDLFGFVMKIEGLSFPEAVEKLADQAGVTLDRPSAPSYSKEDKENYFQANRVAAWHYHEILKNSPAAEKARKYLVDRGITAAEIETFRLGYCPSSHEVSSVSLLEQYHQRKIPQEAAIKVGIIREGDYGVYETFRERIIFPIFNRENKAVGLGGRILTSDKEMAKYINSSDSPVYDKSSTLFGLPLAKEALRKKNRVFVVEGYLDAIALHQFGFQEVVAPLGTALTSKQIALLKRYTDEIIVLFDGDEAGLKAAQRSLELFLEQGVSPKILILPEGEDPDTFLRKFGTKSFEEKLKEVRNLFSWIIDKTLAKQGRDISGKSAALEHLRPYLLKLSRPLERNLHIRSIARGLDVPETWILESLGLKPIEAPIVKRTHSGKSTPAPVISSSEEALLELFIKFENLRSAIIDKLSSDEFINEECRELAGLLWNQVGSTPLAFDQIMDRISKPEVSHLFRKLALKDHDWEGASLDQAAGDCIARIKHKTLKLKLGDLSLQIREAEAGQQNERVAHLLKEKQLLLAGLSGPK